MGAVLANLAQAVGGGGDAPALMTGTGKDDVHLLVVCTAERGLCGGFNSPDRAPRPRPHPQAAGRGQDGQDHLRRQEGLRHPAPRLRTLIIERVDLREVKTLGFANADAIAQKVIQLFDDGEFDVCTLFYSQFKSVIAQIPTAQQLIPAGALRRRPRRRTAAAPSTNTSRSRARSSPTCCRATSPCRSSARCSRTPPPRWAPR